MTTRLAVVAALTLFAAATAIAEPPDTSYIFPAGGQRGTKVSVRVGGFYLHEGGDFEMLGDGVDASPRIERTETIWFEGPVIPQPASQRGENYPKDYAGTVEIAGDAKLGPRFWRVRGSQGVTGLRKFVIGDLPEVIEKEIDGKPVPAAVEVPVTINGRIFPREDVDVWTFSAKARQSFTCEVNAARLGSPLDSRLEVRGPDGQRIAENVDALGTDSRVQFTAPADGTYSVSIHDINFGGLQDYVYRLTISDGPWINSVYPLGAQRGTTASFRFEGANLPDEPVALDVPAAGEEFVYRHPGREGIASNPVSIALGEFAEVLEEDTSAATVHSTPVVLNGRILQPGEADVWRFAAKKNKKVVLDLQAARLGSPLDSVVTVFDESGKELANSDDMGKGQTDSRLTFAPPADGTYAVHVEDRLPTRGGTRFAYRLEIKPAKTEATGLGFDVSFPNDVINLERGKELKLRVDVERRGGLKEPIEMLFEGLPEGVTVENATIAKNKKRTQLVIAAAETAKIGTSKLALRARSAVPAKKVVEGRLVDDGEQEITGQVKVASASGLETDEVLLAVTVPTPFKFFGVFETRYAPQGSVYRRHYEIDRGGFEGPIEISLADKQIRHLQGVTGPTIVVPPGETEFDYPVKLPPWLVIGRTSRTQLMAVGIVEEPDGSKHKVTYTSGAQNDQIILLADPNRLAVTARVKSIQEQPGGEVDVPVTVGRGPGLSGPVTVALKAPAHLREAVQAEAVTIPANETDGVLTVRFPKGAPGVFNMPVRIQATMRDERGDPVLNQTKLEIVPK